MKLYLRGKYYYFKPCINGKQRWVNTHEENRLKAKLFAEDYLHDKRHSTTKIDGKYNFETMLWTDFCDKFIAYSKYNKSAPEADIRVIKAINNNLDLKYFKELNADKIRKYISIRKEIDKLKDNSLNRDLHSIKSMWKFATTDFPPFFYFENFFDTPFVLTFFPSFSAILLFFFLYLQLSL